MAQAKVTYALVTTSIATAIACQLLTVGCAPRQHSGLCGQDICFCRAKTRLAKAFAGLVECSSARIITTGEQDAVRQFTRDCLWQGVQEPLALMVLDDKVIADKWYPYMESAFADAWRGRDVPITMGASPHIVEALKAIAIRGLSRDARVAAAIAIERVEPEIARSVFVNEYADFVLPPFNLGYGHIPVAVGEHLAVKGIHVPEEIVTLWDAGVLLTTRERRELDPVRLRATAQLYNQTLRDLLVAGQWTELKKLRQGGYVDMIYQVWESVRYRGTEPRNGPGIFGTEDGTLRGQEKPRDKPEILGTDTE